jgi:putative membrane protein
MMYGNGFAWGWMWFGGVVTILILAALIVLIVRTFTVGTTARDGKLPPQANSARQIAEERLARGELTPDEFRQVARALEENP